MATPTTRACFYVHTVRDTGYGDLISMFPVLADDPMLPQGRNIYHEATPSGQLEITVTNPNVQGQIREGQRYYVDFTLVEEA